MQFNKQIALISLGIMILASGCRSKKYEERIAQLELELSQSNALLTKTDSTMELISLMLDSVETNEAIIGIDFSKLDDENQDSILLKIEGAKAYIEFSRLEITRLEKSLEEEVGKSGKAQKRINGLLGTINRLKRDLQAKEDSLIVLNDKIVNLEEDKSILANTVQKQKIEINRKTELIATQEQTLQEREAFLKKQEEEIELQEKATRIQEAEKFYALGKQDEILGDKTKFAAKKKKSYYQSAELYYQQAYELGKADAKEAMYNVKDKSIKIKFGGKN